MESLGFRLREEALLKTLTLDVLKTSEIEGELFSPSRCARLSPAVLAWISGLWLRWIVMWKEWSR